MHKPVDLSPFCARARKFVVEGRVNDAFDLYDDILKVDPDNAMAYADRGTTYAMCKNHDRAVSDLSRAFELGYAEASAYSSLATVFNELGEFEKSLEYFAKALNLDSGYSFAHYNRSCVFQQLGDIAGAIEGMERVPILAETRNFWVRSQVELML